MRRHVPRTLRRWRRPASACVLPDWCLCHVLLDSRPANSPLRLTMLPAAPSPAAPRALRQLAEETLWGLLGEQLPAAEVPGGKKAPFINEIHKHAHWEKRFLFSRCRPLDSRGRLSAKEVAKAYEEVGAEWWWVLVGDCVSPPSG